MKAILEFNLPDEQEEYKMANAAPCYHSALWDLAQEIRNKLKYEDLTPEQDKAWEEIKTVFWDLMNEYNIKLD